MEKLFKGQSISLPDGALFLFDQFRILLEVLSYLRGLTLKLQMQSVDVMQAYEEVDSVISRARVQQDMPTSLVKSFMGRISSCANSEL